MLLPDTSVSVSFNLATYRGEQGFSGSVVARVRENVWISGGIGGSTGDWSCDVVVMSVFE